MPVEREHLALTRMEDFADVVQRMEFAPECGVRNPSSRN